jgi:hypothetical protein
MFIIEQTKEIIPLVKKYRATGSIIFKKVGPLPKEAYAQIQEKLRISNLKKGVMDSEGNVKFEFEQTLNFKNAFEHHKGDENIKIKITGEGEAGTLQVKGSPLPPIKYEYTDFFCHVKLDKQKKMSSQAATQTDELPPVCAIS